MPASAKASRAASFAILLAVAALFGLALFLLNNFGDPHGATEEAERAARAAARERSRWLMILVAVSASASFASASWSRRRG